MITATNKGGLANRIKCICSCMRYANKHKINYRVYWEILDDYNNSIHILNCPFNQLFSNKIEANKVEGINYGHHCMIIFDDDDLPPNFNTFSSKCSKPFTKSDPLNRNIDFMYNDIPNAIKVEYINYFKKLQPITDLQSKIDEFYNDNFDERTVSVHIRSWNRNGEQQRRDGLYDLNKFEHVMDIHNKDVKFYLATDSSDVQKYFLEQSRFRNRIITYSRTTTLDTSRDYSDSIQEDLIELYLLSKNKTIIGSHNSTYTEAAWWLGGCTDDIVII